MKVDVGTFAAEFPNDNPSLHGGALWVCHDVVGAPVIEIVERAGGSAVTALGIMPAAIIAARGPAPEIRPQYEDAQLALSETAAAIAHAADILTRALHIEDPPIETDIVDAPPQDAIDEENMAINALVAEAVHVALAEVKAVAAAAAVAQREAEARAHAVAEAEAVAAVEAMAMADAEATAISAQVADAVMAAIAAEAKAKAQAEAKAQADAEAKAQADAEAEAEARAQAEADAQAEAEAEAQAQAEAEAKAQAEAEAKAQAEAQAATADADAEDAEARPARPSGIMLVGERATLEEDEHEELVVEELEPLAAETEIEIVAASVDAPLTTTASEAATILPPASDDPFQLFVTALESLAIAEGSPWAASVVGPLLGQGIAPGAVGGDAQAALVAGGILDGDAPTPAFLAVACAWREILRGTSEDWSACGAMMLDEWAADVLARLMGAPDRTSTLRRELRTRGVAAFGLVEAA